MRKLSFTVAALAVCAVSLVAEEVSVTPASTMAEVSLLNVGNYSKLFLNGGGRPDSKYFRVATDEDWEKIASLGGEDLGNIDTPLEISLLSYAAGVIDIRPVAADAILPANDPKLSDLKLGAAVFQEIQILRFLGNTAAVGCHEGILQHSIINRGNVSRAEIEAYYKNGIRSLIADAVNVEFNKISIPLYRYDAVLTRTTGSQYILSYKDVNDVVKELTAPSLDALSSVMSRSGDFIPSDIDTVRSQAALIPAVKLGKQSLDEITEILTKFYTSPGQSTYNYVRDVYFLYDITELASRDAFFGIVRGAYYDTLDSLNTALAQRVSNDASQQRSAAALTRDQQRRLVSLRE